MSGGEAAAAFALAAGAISVAAFFLQLWDNTAQVRKTGSTITTADCAREAKLLTQQCEEVKRRRLVKFQLEESARLDAIAEEIISIVGEIADRLSKCRIPEDSEGPRWFRDLIVNVLWNGKRTDVEAQMERLQALRNELQFQVVISIMKKVDVEYVQQTKEFDALGGELKRLVHSLIDGEDSFDSELREIKSILLNTCRETVPVDRDSSVKRIIDRLWFNAISHRHSDIKQAHKKTFEWVFTGQKKTELSSMTFIEWMKSSQGLYWISGRAGTGKSSLMRFLNDDLRTKVAFQEWAGERPLIMASFYFWNAEGSSTDIRLRRLEGLYQGLLCRILEGAPDLAEHLFPDHLGRPNLGPFPTLVDLKEAFMRLLRAKTLPVVIGLIIDGLDEYDASLNEQIELANMLKDAGTKPHLKVLISSRPEAAFESALSCCARLRLDELTENDRRIYVTDSLNENSLFQALNTTTEAKGSLTTQIVEKSEGIFLWVHIVVSAIREELFVAKDIASLHKVVDEMPHGNDGLFNLCDHMLRKRIPPQFRIFGFRMIWTLQQCYELRDKRIPWVEGPDWYHPATGLLFSFLDNDDASSFKDELLPESELRERLDRTARALCRNCAGLLEMRSTPEATWRQNREASEDFDDPKVHFLHKDVSIFLAQQRQQALVEGVLQPVASTLHTELLKCLVVVLKTYNPSAAGKSFVPWQLAEASMRVARVAEEYDAAKTEDLLDQLDQTMGNHLPYLTDFPYQGGAELGSRSSGKHWVDFFPYDSFHLSRRYYPWPNPDEDYNLDFLCFAIQNGLFYYVRSKVTTSPRVRKRKGIPLLSCACAPVPHWWLLKPNPIQLRTVEMLLHFGADPNEEFGGYSPWQMVMLVALDSALLNSAELGELAKILRVLLQHGANPKTGVKWSEVDGIQKGMSKRADYKRSSKEQIRITFIDRFSKPAEAQNPVWLSNHCWIRELVPCSVSEDDSRKFLELGEELIALVREKEKEKRSRRIIFKIIQTAKAVGMPFSDVLGLRQRR